MHRLGKDAKIAVDWFAYNDMKLNPDKCRILTSGFKHEIMITNIENALVIEAQKVRLLGIDIDTKLSFSGHIESICKKAILYNNFIVFYIFIVTISSLVLFAILRNLHLVAIAFFNDFILPHNTFILNGNIFIKMSVISSLKGK